MPDSPLPATSDVPLYVDLDGTLAKADMLAEGALQLLKHNPALAFAMVYWLVTGGKASLKAEIACRVDAELLQVPLQEQFVSFLRHEAGRNRPLFLATASDERNARALASRLGCFSGVLASDGRTNLAGRRKLAAIVEHCGRLPFDYAGNDWRDMAVWREARGAVLVNPAPGVAGRLRAMGKLGQVFDDRPRSVAIYARAMRLHQWVKNLLLFVPLFMAQRWSDTTSLRLTIVAFVAFGMCASATYLCNDLLDLPADRRHVGKSRRPLAAGDLSVPAAFALIGVTYTAGIGLALTLPSAFMWILVIYIVLTTAYSLRIKQLVIMDVLCLGTLYSLRILAGASATGIMVSSWLLAYSMFLFLSLALVKRCSELEQFGRNDPSSIIAGRDYRVSDSGVLAAMGVASAYVSVLVLALFVNSESVAERYAQPQLLWLLCPAMLFWVSRLWIKTTRGEINDDPILFSIRDRASWIVLAVVVGIWVSAQVAW